MTRRFKYAIAGGPPAFYSAVEIIHEPSGELIEYVTEANAVEGWLIRYVVNADGRVVRGADGNAETERIEAPIKIVAGDRYPPNTLDVNLTADIEAGVIFEEDLTDDDRSWLAHGKPDCAGCGRAAVSEPGRLCDWCLEKGKKP